MPDQSLGHWTITDVLGASLPKKARLELTLVGDGLRFRSDDGTIDLTVPASRCRYEPYQPKSGYLTWGADSVWLKTQDEKAAADLDAALKLRYVPQLLPEPVPEPDPTEPTFTKVYRAPQPHEAAKAMTDETARFANLGYALVSQSWAEPDRSSQVALRVGGVLVFLFGLLFLGAFQIAIVIWIVALLLFVLSLLSAGEGSLLATFERRAEPASASRDAAQAPEPVSAPERTQSARTRLLELTQLRDEGLITEQEWATKREELIRAL